MRPIYNMIDKPLPPGSFDALRWQLMMSSGPYCSLCEIPLGGEMEVAQRVCTSADWVVFRPPGSEPFRWYLGQPWAALTFRNSLLSCRSCLALRGPYPSNYEALEVLYAEDPSMYQQVLASMRSGAKALPPEQTEAIYQAAAYSMLWPDSSLDADGDVTFAGTVSEPTFTFEYSSSSQVDLANRELVRLSQAEAQARWANTPQLGLWVVPNPNLPTLSERERAYSTVQMSSLNSFNPVRAPLDARVWRRTQALGAVEAAWAQLHWLLGGALHWYSKVQNPLELLLMAPSVTEAAQNIREQIRTTGFWSVWFWRFSENMKTQEPWSRLSARERELVLYSLFIQYEPRNLYSRITQPAELVNVLKGTDLDRIPLFRTEGRR